MKDNVKPSIRLDQFLFFIRLFKSRNLASQYISNGKLKIGDLVVKKPYKKVVVGNIVTLESFDNIIKIIKILKIPFKRGPFSEAIKYYDDMSPIQTKVKKIKTTNSFISRVGRPTKHDRRKIDELMGRN